MGKILTLDIGSSSSKLCLSEKKFNNLEILFYAEKTYANPVRDNLSNEMIDVISNQLKNLIRDYKNVENEIIDCNLSFSGTNVSSVIIESSLENLDSSKIITQEQLNLLTKNNPKINSFSSKKTAHIIALDYSLDGMIGIRHPLGMHSKNILVQNLYVNIDSEHYEKIVKAVTDSGLKCNFITSDIVALSKYLLNSDEREIGSLIIDIGSSTTSYCLSKKGNPILTGALPVGGSQFTSDLSIAFSTNIDFANQLKLETSCTPENERIAEKVIVRDKDSSKTFEITKRQISQVLKERAVEIFTLIKQDIIEKMGVENLPERLILCGGGSKLQGIVALGRYIFQSKARLAETKNLKFLGENLPIESMAVISSANLIHELDFQNEYIHKSNSFMSENGINSFSIETKKLSSISSNVENNVKMLLLNINQYIKKFISSIKR
tara:strand:- start:7067 stop:8377 length:1311 start_codon:yes stop_codon:yes gene_type:complete